MAERNFFASSRHLGRRPGAHQPDSETGIQDNLFKQSSGPNYRSGKIPAARETANPLEKIMVRERALQRPLHLENPAFCCFFLFFSADRRHIPFSVHGGESHFLAAARAPRFPFLSRRGRFASGGDIRRLLPLCLARKQILAVSSPFVIFQSVFPVLFDVLCPRANK